MGGIIKGKKERNKEAYGVEKMEVIHTTWGRELQDGGGSAKIRLK